MNPAVTDPWLALELSGVHAIEASAGTGKTYTLATLYTRLVLERQLRVDQILAVTFTEAATQELRARVRKRLLLAAAVAAAPGDDGPDDAAGNEAGNEVDSETALTRAMIQAWQARSGETAAAIRQRLQQAADDIDLAAVHTIHGFCHRVLREHALESGQGFDDPELLTRDDELRAGIAADLWRWHGRDEAAAHDLAQLWPKGPDDLAEDLKALLREPRLLPPAPANPAPDASGLQAAACKALAAAARAHGPAFRDDLLAARADGVLNRNSYQEPWIRQLFAALADWCADTEPATVFRHDKLANLTADMLAAKTNKKATRPAPESPLCAAIGDYLEQLARFDRAGEERQLALLHALRDDARQRMARQKRQARALTFDDLIDRVAAALDGPAGGDLVAQLRAQYAVALVDEFQDTDARQWRIFNRIFGHGDAADAGAQPPGSQDAGPGTGKGADMGAGPDASPGTNPEPGLFLIGDPKQAIYRFRGGDVDTYLAASARARPAPRLDLNFRSRPALLQGVAALYAQAQAMHEADPKTWPPPFIDEDIAFHPVHPGGSRADGDYQRNGRPAAAITLWQAPEPEERYAKGDIKPYSSPQSHALATRACVAAIHDVLTQARAGKAQIHGKPVQPGNIAVLVRSHRQALLMRDALARAGIPAVAAGRQSLFATDEARELHSLLQAVVHAADDRRLRAALATVLVGVDAAGIAALDSDAPALAAQQLNVMAWRERLQRGGPLALVGDLCAAAAQRLLGLLDGERRLTNYMQLAEHLQEARRSTLGLHGLLDWLARAIAQADDRDEAQQLRLESDARRVQILTLHKSKGLEYPLVYLPYVGIGSGPRKTGRHIALTGKDGSRSLHWRLLEEDGDWEQALERWRRAERAEDARLLYVGLTRARDALWLATGRFYNHTGSPLWTMVGDLSALAADDGNLAAPVFHCDSGEPPGTLDWLAPEDTGAVPPARVPATALRSDWWVYSFTQLAHSDGFEGAADPAAAATQPVPGGRDEPAHEPSAEPDDLGADTGTAAADGEDGQAPGQAAVDPRFLGPAFGVVLHEVFETTDFAAWKDWRAGQPPPPAERETIAQALRAAGHAADLVEPGIEAITPLVGHSLTARLPEGLVLATLPEADRRAEIEFQFALAPTRVDALLALLHRHGLLRERQGFGARRTLEGLMTGLIDLTYLHEGRWYVLDWKSNRLPAYDAAQLQAAMERSQYTLQALIYTLALHRWLRFRFGSGYDYARDFGGARYLFCRGIDASRSDPPGIQAWKFEPALVHALDALFAGQTTGAAA